MATEMTGFVFEHSPNYFEHMRWYEQNIARQKFFCVGCERNVSAENGAADDVPELCDNCWCDVTEKREMPR